MDMSYRLFSLLSSVKLLPAGQILPANKCWRQLVKGLGSTAERGMRGCSVSVKQLIANVFWLICKDERKKRNDRLSEGDSIFPYIKNIPGFLKKMVMFLRNITIFLENIKVFLQHGSVPKLNRPIPSSAVGARSARPKTVCFVSSGRRTLPLGTKRQHCPHFDTSPVCKVCTYASDYTYGGIRPHVYTYRATRTYAWACTYICHCVRLRHILYPGLINLSSLLTNAFSCCIFVVRQI